MNGSVEQPTLAIVLPVYKHPGLVMEAVHTALMDPEAVVIAVNDGCPFPQTDVVLGEFAAAEPRMHYVRKSNGGLSSARNAGIDYVMACLPSVEALYLLDADNRLHQGAVSRAWQKLQETGFDWLYPGIYMFGERQMLDYEGEYSVLSNLAQNTCEAGSLVRSRVFESGVRFDESMQKGYEDWDFWLTCAANGFRGQADNDLGFMYRSRPESMLSNSDRDNDAIMAYMHDKWRDLFKPSSIVNLECREAPRYGYVSSNDDTMRLGTDPMDLVGDQPTRQPFLQRLVSYNQASKTTYFPPFLVFGDEGIVGEMAAPACCVTSSGSRNRKWKQKMRLLCPLIRVRIRSPSVGGKGRVREHHCFLLPVMSSRNVRWIAAWLGQRQACLLPAR